jgi:hypothetical protein
MERGKQVCKILKDIRKQIAEENNIEFITSECQHKGDCAGTCPKCEAEVRYLESQLARRRAAGYPARLAGVSLGLAAVAPALLSCDAFRTTGDITPPLTGDVPMAGEPVVQDSVHLGANLVFELIAHDKFMPAFSSGGWQQTEIYDVYPNGSLGEEIMGNIDGYTPVKMAVKEGQIKNYRSYNAEPVNDYELLEFSYDEWANGLWIGNLYNFTVASIDDTEMICYGPVFSQQWAPEAFLGKYVFKHVSDETVSEWDELHSTLAE